MWTVAFWKAAVERSVKTFAQTFVALVGAGQVNLLETDLTSTAGVALGAALLSICTSLGTAKLTNGDASLV